MANTTKEWMDSMEAQMALKVSTTDPRLTDALSPVFAILAATALDLAANDMVKVSPTANTTYTTTVPPAGKIKTVIVLTSGTTSRILTFGTGFKPTGTLATGTTASRVYVVTFVSDGTNLYEASRTVAMVA